MVSVVDEGVVVGTGEQLSVHRLQVHVEEAELAQGRGRGHGGQHRLQLLPRQLAVGQVQLLQPRLHTEQRIDGRSISRIG